MTDNDLGRGDDRAMRDAAGQQQPTWKVEKACSLLIVLPVALVAAAAIIVIPFFRR